MGPKWPLADNRQKEESCQDSEWGVHCSREGMSSIPGRRINANDQLESLYRSATIVANLCVYASTSESHPIVLVQPAEPALIKLADTLGVKGHGIGDLVHEEKIQREVLHQMQAIGRRSGLAGIEMIVGVVLADEEWTPQNVRDVPMSPALVRR